MIKKILLDDITINNKKNLLLIYYIKNRYKWLLKIKKKYIRGMVFYKYLIIYDKIYNSGIEIVI